MFNYRSKSFGMQVLDFFVVQHCTNKRQRVVRKYLFNKVTVVCESRYNSLLDLEAEGIASFTHCELW